MPTWLPLLAKVSLLLAVICALLISIDIIAGRRQRMWIMNIVWPVTALYSGPIGLWFYWCEGRALSRDNNNVQQQVDPGHSDRWYWQSVALAATHCGAGCTLGDITAESILIAMPFTFLGRHIFASWVVDFVAAFIIGIAFQYFTIVPMRKLSPLRGLIAALKADTLSLTAWQIGMYGWMAVVTFGLFGRELDKLGASFWFMMQIAMLAGFLTSYPVNWWLVKSGIKEKM